MLDGLSNTIGIGFDWSEQRLYYSDVTKDVIKRCYLNGSECEDVITTGLSMTEGKLVIWLSLNVCFMVIWISAII